MTHRPYSPHRLGVIHPRYPYIWAGGVLVLGLMLKIRGQQSFSLNSSLVYNYLLFSCCF